jgi:hypothetical protein
MAPNVHHHGGHYEDDAVANCRSRLSSTSFVIHYLGWQAGSGVLGAFVRNGDYFFTGLTPRNVPNGNLALLSFLIG